MLYALIRIPLCIKLGMKQTQITQKLSISRCFSLQENEKEILLILAKFGPLNKSQIDGHCNKLSHRQIEYAIDTFLLKNKLVKIHSKKHYRNITKAFYKSKNSKNSTHGHVGGKKIYEIIYTLSEKGWLASIDLIPFDENYYLSFHIDRCPENKKQLLRDYVKVRLEILALNLNLFNMKLESFNNLELLLRDIFIFWEYVFESNDTEKIAKLIYTRSDELENEIRHGDKFLEDEYSPLIEKIMGLQDISSLRRLSLTKKLTISNFDTRKTEYYTKKEYDKKYPSKTKVIELTSEESKEIFKK